MLCDLKMHREPLRRVLENQYDGKEGRVLGVGAEKAAQPQKW
jgi:hypothetical protein